MQIEGETGNRKMDDDDTVDSDSQKQREYRSVKEADDEASNVFTSPRKIRDHRLQGCLSIQTTRHCSNHLCYNI
jgi:hypothetical protein